MEERKETRVKEEGRERKEQEEQLCVFELRHRDFHL